MVVGVGGCSDGVVVEAGVTEPHSHASLPHSPGSTPHPTQRACSTWGHGE